MTSEDMNDRLRLARKAERAWMVEHLRACGMHVAADELEATRYVWEDPARARTPAGAP